MYRAFAIAGALTAALVLYLFIEVRAEPEVEIDESKIAAARQQADAEARRRSSTPAPVSSAGREVRVKPPATTTSPEPERSRNAAPEPLAAAGMSYKSLATSEIPDLADKPFVTKVKEARRLYGRRRYEQAYALALELLEEEPNNRRVLRVVIASACIMANPDSAKQYYERLKLPRDRSQMRRRCEAYGVELPE